MFITYEINKMDIWSGLTIYDDRVDKLHSKVCLIVSGIVTQGWNLYDTLMLGAVRDGHPNWRLNEL